MTGGADSVDIDARGLKCPWPALRLARFMRGAEAAVIVADDPVAPREIAALADENGWFLKSLDTEIGAGWLVSK